MCSHIFTAFVLLSLPLAYSSEFINTTVAGNITDTWTCNFTIFANHIQGVVLYCFDSLNDQFGVTIKQGNDNSKKDVRIKFNSVYKDIPIKSLCGCDTCDGTKVTMLINATKGMINVSCNDYKSEFILLGNGRIKDPDNVEYPIPAALVNTTKTILMMMGNIGPYLSQGNVTVHPIREQMDGCVYSFHYNGQPLTLVGNGTKVLPSCPTKCTNSTCHGAPCTEVTSTSVSCDCSTTAFNGPYCDRSMRMYDPSGNNTLENIHTINQYIYLKMTWRILLYENYCLMEIVNSNDASVTISIKKNHLLINSTVMSDTVDMEGINFVRVNITKNDFTVTIKNKTSKLYTTSISNGNTTINIGFSTQNKDCKPFQGAYDIDFNSSLIRSIRLANAHNSSTTISIVNSTQAETTKSSPGMNSLHLIIMMALVFLIVITSLTIGLMKIRQRKKRLNRHNQIIEIRKINSVNMRSETEYAYSALDYAVINAGNTMQDIYDYVPMMSPRPEEPSPPPIPPRE